jgi:hypothetical protein
MRNRIATGKAFLVAVVVFGLLFVPSASAGGGIAVVDQFFVQPVRLWDSIQLLGPIGQEFTPSVSGLDAVELWTGDFTRGNGVGALLQVNIRKATITGELLATSLPVDLPDSFDGVTHFDFPGLVRLTPNEMYVIEVLVVGDNWVVTHNWSAASCGGGPDCGYAGGNWIIQGNSVPGNALWFQEGLAASTPRSADYCKQDLWQVMSRADASKFKNQGDCVQYVNTGK